MAYEMETVREAIDRLRTIGFTADWQAHDRMIRCGSCGLTVDPSLVTVDEIVRFEGSSDPGDQAILLALRTSDGHRGLYVTAYGPDTPAADVDVLAAFRLSRPTAT